MKIVAKLILCLGLVFSFNTFAADCSDDCKMCATNCAGKPNCPAKEVCEACPTDCSPAAPASPATH